jgi:selenophosphate synthetase-related protein
LLTRRAVNDWKQHPVTEEIFKQLREQLDAYAAAVLGGHFLKETPEKTAMEMAQVAGVVKGITMILDIEGQIDE